MHACLLTDCSLWNAERECLGKEEPVLRLTDTRVMTDANREEVRRTPPKPELPLAGSRHLPADWFQDSRKQYA